VRCALTQYTLRWAKCSSPAPMKLHSTNRLQGTLVTFLATVSELSGELLRLDTKYAVRNIEYYNVGRCPT